jgi:hypothetical protein
VENRWPTGRPVHAKPARDSRHHQRAVLLERIVLLAVKISITAVPLQAVPLELEQAPGTRAPSAAVAGIGAAVRRAPAVNVALLVSEGHAVASAGAAAALEEVGAGRSR